MSLGLSEKKVSLESITLHQYTEASMRILRELIIQDQMTMPEVLQYIGYVTKVASMAQVFPWRSILKYDQEYRKQQAAMSFPWGADSPYLMHLFLSQDDAVRQTMDRQPDRQRGPSTSRNKYDLVTGKIVCEKFNGRNGCNLRSCNYAHVCLECYDRAHGEFQHKQKAHNAPPASTEPSKNG